MQLIAMFYWGVMSESSFVQIFRDLLRDPSVTSLPPSYRVVLYTLLDYACFSKCKQDDHGVLIDLLPGQFMCTIRGLADLANVGKNDAERALSKFVDLKIVRQEVRHRKTVITILWGLKFKDGETRSEPRKRQERDTKEEHNTDSSIEEPVCLFVDEKKMEEEMDNSPLIVARSKKHSSGVTSIRLNELTKQLLVEEFSHQEINEAIGILKNSDPALNAPIKNYLVGIIKKQRLMQVKPKKENLEWKNKKTKEKSIPTSKKLCEKDNVFYSEKDMSESPLAKFAALNGLK